MITRVTNIMNQATVLQEKILSSLTEAQQRVAIIASAAFALLAAVILMYKYCPRKSDQIKESIKETQKVEDLPKEPPSPPSKIPLIGGYGIMHYQRQSCENLFTMLNDKTFFDPEKDKESVKVIDDFAALVQFGRYESKIIIDVFEQSNGTARDQHKLSKEDAAKGCHFHVYTYSGGFGSDIRRELAISHEFLKQFSEAEGKGDKADLKALLLKLVDELKEALRLEEKRKEEGKKLASFSSGYFK